MTQPELPGIYTPTFPAGRQALRSLPVHAHGPQTERDAAESHKGRAETTRGNVAWTLRLGHARTATEIAYQLLAMKPVYAGRNIDWMKTEVRRRLNDLLNQGRVARTDRALPGEREVRWTATEKGDNI